MEAILAAYKAKNEPLEVLVYSSMAVREHMWEYFHLKYRD